jgi:hypothetical protein
MVTCAGYGVFGQWVCQLESFGVLDVLLPFLLVFTIAFAVFQKSRILGPDSKRFNTLVSLVLALAVVIPHVVNPGGPADVVNIINAALPNVSLLMIASMMVLLLIGVFGTDVNIAGTNLEGIVVILSFLAVGFTFLVSAGVIDNPPSWLSWLFDPQTESILVAILVFGIIVWFITKEDRPENQREPVYDTINKMFGGVLGGGKNH